MNPLVETLPHANWRKRGRTRAEKQEQEEKRAQGLRASDTQDSLVPTDGSGAEHLLMSPHSSLGEPVDVMMTFNLRGLESGP